MENLVVSKNDCIWCQKAKELLDRKGIEYKEKVLGVDFTIKQFKEIAPAAKTVPQIWLGNVHVGGFTDLEEWLEMEDRLA